MNIVIVLLTIIGLVLMLLVINSYHNTEIIKNIVKKHREPVEIFILKDRNKAMHEMLFHIKKYFEKLEISQNSMKAVCVAELINRIEKLLQRNEL